jgi:hypothetical protein
MIKLRGLAKLLGITLGSFLSVWMLIAILGIAAHSIAFPRWLQTCFLIIAVALPFALSWQAIRTLKQSLEFGVKYPENAVGGMAVGLAISLPITFAFMGAAALGAGSVWSWTLLIPIVPGLIAMALGALGAALVERRICGLLFASSPFVWIVMFIAVAMMPESSGPKDYGPMSPARVRAKVLTIRCGPRRGRRAPAEEVLKMNCPENEGSN